MEKKKKSDVLGLQGQQRRLEISAVHLSTATISVWCVSHSHPWAGSLPGEDAFTRVDAAIESNSLLWQPSICTDGNVSLSNAFRGWWSHNINSGGERFSQLRCHCELEHAHMWLAAIRAAQIRSDFAPSFSVAFCTWYCSDWQKWSVLHALFHLVVVSVQKII